MYELLKSYAGRDFPPTITVEELKEKLTTDVKIISLDLSSTFNCMKLYNKVKKED